MVRRSTSENSLVGIPDSLASLSFTRKRSRARLLLAIRAPGRTCHTAGGVRAYVRTCRYVPKVFRTRSYRSSKTDNYSIDRFRKQSHILALLLPLRRSALFSSKRSPILRRIRCASEVNRLCYHANYARRDTYRDTYAI